MLKRIVFVLTLVLVSQGICHAQQNPATGSSAASNQIIPAFQINEFGAYNTLRAIAQKVRIVIGFETVQPAHESTLTFEFPGGKVADLLDEFIRTYPDYSWEEASDGIIHVISKQTTISLADVVLSYPGALKQTREKIWEDLAKRPEVLAWLTSSHCSRAELFNGTEFRNNNEPLLIEPERVTLKRLLDQIAKESGVNSWAIIRSPSDAPCQISIIVW